jgi:GDP-4-dehydro-6-deoxy-D-mannose reductase
MTRFLLTGGGGFVGQWLARLLLERGHDVTLAGVGALADGPCILTASERSHVRWVAADVRSQPDIERMLDAAQPAAVVHLAGVAFPPDADRDPAATYEINTLGAVRVLSSLAVRCAAGTLDAIAVVVGTGLQYGAHAADEMPLRETAPQHPLTAYAATKLAQEIAALQIGRASALRVVCTRSFNHSGVGHGAHYLLPSLVGRILALRSGASRQLALGNDVVRDYLHVRDVAAAYLALAERGRAGEAYNVSSGVGVSVRQLAVDALLRAGMNADISTEPSLVRAMDIPVLVGSPGKLERDTGWRRTLTHADIIDDLIHAATH